MSAIEPLISDRAPVPLDEAVGRAALRKAAWRLIPLLAFGYGIAYMDRVNISFASLQMNRDLHFSASVYGFGAGLFFVSYAACEVPSNLLLYRVGASRWFARIMLTWGLVAVGMMFVKTPVEFYIMRFLLGMAEAGFFPGVVFYLGLWFPTHVRAQAISRFYISLPLSTVFMGVIAGALLDLQGKAGLAGWQWLFLIEGMPAIVLSIIFLLYLPVGPSHAKWLTPDERQWISHHASKVEPTHILSGKASRVLLDHRVWQISLVFLCMLTCSYGYNFSAPAILKTLTHFNNRDVGFLVAAMNLLGAPSMILNAMHSDHTRERYFHVAIPFLMIAAGYLIAGWSISPWLVVPALAVVNLSFFAIQGALLALATSFLHGKSAATGIAVMNTIGILGGFLGPYGMGLAKDSTGSYQPGLLMLAIPALISAATIFMMKFQSQTRKGPESSQ
jgi:ACS family tartrate transporter-like MFS transporter